MGDVSTTTAMYRIHTPQFMTSLKDRLYHSFGRDKFTVASLSLKRDIYVNRRSAFFTSSLLINPSLASKDMRKGIYARKISDSISYTIQEKMLQFGVLQIIHKLDRDT